MLLLFFGTAAVSDNAAFLARQVHNQWQNPEEAGYYLTPAERDMFGWIEGHGLDGVLLCPDARLSYLSATYTDVRPYFGHWSETPHFQSRIEQVRGWFEQGKVGPWLGEMDYILIASNQLRSFHRLTDWRIVYENEELQLFEKPAR